MSLAKKWRLFPADSQQQRLLSQALDISPTTAQILINRGIKNLEEAQAFLNPSLTSLPNPFLLPDMGKGVRRLIQAIARKEGIAIYGDYDVDGLTATALLSLFFQELGVAVTTHIPDRMAEGYGIHAKTLEALKAKGVRVVVTVDCGTKSHEALEEGKKMGLDCIVTDHHEPDQKTSPAFAFINPQNLPQGAAGRGLAGVGVAFFLLMALRQKMREENLFPNGEPNLKQHLDLVALGTIGDLAPLTGTNRILVSFGLKELAQTKKPGLIALKEVGRLEKAEVFKASDIGFRLAPRINAGGRIAKASLGLDLLRETDLDRARKLSKILDQCNADRQTLQEKHLQEAWEQADAKQQPFGLVVASPGWHPGIVGLVASRITEKYYRPSVALSIDGELARGSARSIPGIHIVDILNDCSSLLEQFGGHAAAAGLTLRVDKLQHFEEKFGAVIQAKSGVDTFVPTLHLDCELKLSDIRESLLEELEQLKPFGIQNPTPLFYSKNITMVGQRLVGEKHLKCLVEKDQTKIEAIGFNMSSLFSSQPQQREIAFTPQWNVYQNTKTIQLNIKDIKNKFESD